jgi:hypothetical protein
VQRILAQPPARNSCLLPVMSATQLDDLRNAHVTLLTQYQNYLEDVRALQRAVAEDVLPDVLDEAGLELNTLAPVDAEAFAREWLNDEGVCTLALVRETS